MGVMARPAAGSAAPARIAALLVLLILACAGPTEGALRDLQIAQAARAWLGVFIRDLTLESATARDFDDRGGVLLNGVVAGGPADSAGLRAGDIVVAVDGVRLSRRSALAALVGSRKPGQELTVVYYRDGQRRDARVRLAAGSDSEAAILSQDRIDADYDRARQLYDSGDYRGAAALVRPLAEFGDIFAQQFLGLLHEVGQGVDADPALAAHWYRLSGEGGFSVAQFGLASLYERGRGVPRDDRRAYYWYARAAADGYPQAAPERDRLAGLLTDSQIREIEAMATLVPESTETVANAPAPRSTTKTKAAKASVTPQSTYDKAMVSEIQRLLTELGYDPGPADGLMGRRTGQAIAAYQREQGLTPDGKPDSGLLAVLREDRARPASEEPMPAIVVTPPAGVFAPPSAAAAESPVDGNSEKGDDLGDLDDF